MMNWDDFLQLLRDNAAEEVRAAVEEHPELARALDIKSRHSAMNLAVRLGHVECVEVLKPYCDPNESVLSTYGGEETSLLGLAIDKGRPGVVKALLSWCDPLWQSQSGESALMRIATQKGNPKQLKILKLLIPVSNASQRDSIGDTALMGAARALSPKAIEQLVSVDGVSNARGTGSKNALMLALSNESKATDKLECVRLLLEVCAPSERNSRNGATALLQAMGHGDREAVRLLASFGEANAQDNTGCSAIMIAAGRSDLESFKILLPVSDLSLCNKEGKDAFALACDAFSQTGEPRFFELFEVFPAQYREQHAALLAKAIQSACQSSHRLPPEKAQLLMEKAAEYEHRELVASLGKTIVRPSVGGAPTGKALAGAASESGAQAQTPSMRSIRSKRL